MNRARGNIYLEPHERLTPIDRVDATACGLISPLAAAGVARISPTVSLYRLARGTHDSPVSLCSNCHYQGEREKQNANGQNSQPNTSQDSFFFSNTKTHDIANQVKFKFKHTHTHTSTASHGKEKGSKGGQYWAAIENTTVTSA